MKKLTAIYAILLAVVPQTTLAHIGIHGEWTDHYHPLVGGESIVLLLVLLVLAVGWFFSRKQ